VTWYDLDRPHRVLDVAARMRIRPAWIDAVAAPAAAGFEPLERAAGKIRPTVSL
jgi:hypothetical protein